MLYCPQCGNNVKEDELFCVSCGNKLPEDKNQRYPAKKSLNKFWYLPIATFIVLTVASSLFYLFLQHQSTQAKELYEQGEQKLINEEIDQAEALFQKALKQKQNFSQAHIGLAFIDRAKEIQIAIKQAESNLEQGKFQEALSLITNAENKLTNYNGSVVNNLVDELISLQNQVKISQLLFNLEQNPSISELKSLLWEADSINEVEAEEITENIRGQIIEFAYSQASEQLSNNHFNDAQAIVQDGLKYAPSSDKLLSLQTTIEKEKVSFEITQQQRIEQALNTAEEEREFNENDAIELIDIHMEEDDQGNLVIKGEVKSIATVPLQSVLIDYSLIKNEESELLSNEVYVYPDTLYPEEIGKFEFTHYDAPEIKDAELIVNKMTWYTSY
ncbi:zinc-ribbon domain-containing protein [Ornithinibacillus halophilus]|uniref:Zinc-ribbon domain-containing protein n=2 Tax=Ornithinibacillus halophilus TaxID=930117 RepID=A0A1M5I8Q5_9BACI|nr:zinc-ribbon domain-containing protein [Ornithinibacillus halophilus]